MSKTMRIKNIYSASSDDPGIECTELLTEQHHRERVDINNIIAKYTAVGTLPEIQNSMEGIYGDFSGGEDFLESQMKIKQAEEAFMALDAKIRRRFDNEPHKLLEFICNPDNKQEAIELGLINKPISPVEQTLKTTEPSLATTSK